MNVNHAHDKYLVIYYSASGNTKRVANLIEDQLNFIGLPCEKVFIDLNHYFDINIESYKHAFIGTPTYGNGITPSPMLEFLRYILKYNDFKLPSFSVFGTGDTQWEKYCRAVDELEYHLSKKTKVINKLKIEQYVTDKDSIQTSKIYQFIINALGGI
jgi:flavodoxin